jgi:iron complex transport system substrate-binding protein
MTHETESLRDAGGEAAAPLRARQLLPLPPCEATGVYRAIFERRDMRHFAGGAVDERTLSRLLLAAHHAPSVGFMQPWRFIRVRDGEIRRSLHSLVERERVRTAHALGERSQEFLRIKVQGILDAAEVWVVALADGREAHVFGRRTMPYMDLASTACAIQNLWLASRAEGLGLGWVSIFEPADVAQCLGLPADALPIAILCLGPVQGNYDAPLLEQVGWASRLPLQDVVYEDRWGQPCTAIDTSMQPRDVLEHFVDAEDRGPQRIVCLTEETTEWLYLLGQEHRIVGISGYTVRPRRARHEKPKVSTFLSARIEQILALEPDCVFGFSDLQADIAADLARAGVQVTIFNQRSVRDIFSVLQQVAAVVGCVSQGQSLLRIIRGRLQAMQTAVAQRLAQGARRPRVYFEEWDDPPISAIRWVSELIDIAGGQDIFPELAQRPLGKDRIVADPQEVVRRSPDIIIGSWCGKKFRPERVAGRQGWSAIPAVRDGQIFEIKSADILQPGPAALTDGVEQLHRIVLNWMTRHGTHGAV